MKAPDQFYRRASLLGSVPHTGSESKKSQTSNKTQPDTKDEITYKEYKSFITQQDEELNHDLLKKATTKHVLAYNLMDCRNQEMKMIKRQYLKTDIDYSHEDSTNIDINKKLKTFKPSITMGI